MSARVMLIDVGGWMVTAFVPCQSGFHAMERIFAKYPGCTIQSVEITEAAHA